MAGVSVAVNPERAHGSPTKSGDLLPTWPLTAAFVGFPAWWFLGVVDFIWIPIAAVMAFYMVRTRSSMAPRWFGVWLLFLLWAALSVVRLTSLGSLIVFGYRYAIYLACTILLLYLFNSRSSLTDRFVTGALTFWWLVTVAGGYIAMAFPTAVFRTPMSYLLPGGLVSNPWINQMVVRRLSQYNPESYFDLDPRPSAPFLYTNNWGNVYSLLIPFVLIYLIKVRGTKRFWWLSGALVLSLVPAIVTLNRGMFLGIGIAVVYAALRLALLGNFRGVAAVGVTAALGLGVFHILPTEEALQARLNSQSTDDRVSLYTLSIDAMWESPFLGYGRTLDPAETSTRDPVGTQGQFWIILVSHGIGATALFLGWFVISFFMTLRRRDPCGLAGNTVLLVGTIELFYYGFIPYGLPIMMIAAALALRGPETKVVTL